MIIGKGFVEFFPCCHRIKSLVIKHLIL
jgi:hypothetical protein